jgi:hypothetical protein
MPRRRFEPGVAVNVEQLQQLVRVQGELATIEALHRENETLREALHEIARRRQNHPDQRAARRALGLPEDYERALAALATKQQHGHTSRKDTA